MNVIFLSYAREDKKRAEKIRELLEALDINVWMDRLRLLPGLRWEAHIRMAISKCSGAVFLASRYSLSKETYIQNEIELLTQRAATIPEDELFLIIVRLEDIPITDPRLQPFHWVDYFDTKASSPGEFIKVVHAAWSAEEQAERREDTATLETAKTGDMNTRQFRQYVENEEKEIEKIAQAETYVLTPGTTGRLFLPDEVDLFVNKQTKDAYIFHGKVINYDISHLVYVPEDHGIKVVMNDKTCLDLGVKLQWLVRPHFLKAEQIFIVRTEEKKSVDGTTVPLRIGVKGTDGAVVWPPQRRMNSFMRAIRWLWPR